MRLCPDEDEVDSINLTPMIDVVFQLLIFFMVTAVFAITPGLDIKLPEADTAQAPVPDGAIWDHMEPYGGHTKPYGPYGAIQSHMGPYGTIWGHMKLYGAI